MERQPARSSRFPGNVFVASFVVASAVLAIASAIAVTTGFAWAGNSVRLVVDGDASVVRTRAVTVGGLLAESGVPHSSDDLVSPPPDAPLSAGCAVMVRHAVPVTLLVDDAPVEMSVVGDRVSDALVAIGLDPSDSLRVTPPLGERLKPGMSITVDDVFRRLEQEVQPVPYGTREVEDPEAAAGVRRLVKAGVPGRKLRIVQVLVTGGREESRTVMAERVVRKPAAEVIAVGSRRKARLVAVSRLRTAAAPLADGTTMRCVSTAYAPGHQADNITATGARAGYGIIAVDPDVIPLGTRLYVPGYGYGIAADTGGAIHGRKIDVCFDTVAEARAWGRRTVVVTILP